MTLASFGRVAIIQRQVAAAYGLPLTAMVSTRRSRDVALPRQVAMHLARELTALSMPDIGARFGGRDHTTVLHACRVVEGRAGSDLVFAAGLADLRGRVSQALELTLDAEDEALIEAIADKVKSAVRRRLRELASQDGRSLARALIPDLFPGEKR